MPWINSAMPNRKTDTNNRTGFSTDFIGQNYDYPEAIYDERAEIVRAAPPYQQGLMWTLANHPRMPETHPPGGRALGHVPGRVRRGRRLAGAAVRPRSAPDGRATT